MVARRQQVVLTTGIIRRSPKTRFALVDVVNLSKNHKNTVTVQVFDWSNGKPVPLTVNPCKTKRCTVTLGPNSSNFLFANVAKVAFKYEVRITQPADGNVVTNVFGVSKAPFTPQTGETVLQRSLIRVRA